jgi:polyphosphate:AMP phosphotransferase
MFEAAELGQTISKKEFAEAEPELHTELLEVQRQLRKSNIPVIVIVSGVEGAGKGEVVNRLNEWLDARGITTIAFWDQSDEETERPPYWRFWRHLPPRGTIGILFGSWYTKPIIDHVYKNIDLPEYERQLRRISEFEELLTDDGALILKFWFHMSKKDQAKQLKKEAKLLKKEIKSSLTKKFSKRYERFAKSSEHAIRMTDQGIAPWHLVEAVDKRYRDITVGRILLNAVRKRLEQKAGQSVVAKTSTGHLKKLESDKNTILDHVDLARTISRKDYEEKLEKYQSRLYKLAWQARNQKRSSIVMFEGWDAAGKGGAIRRITAAMDARLYKVISIASPTDEEKAQHYLWRFWRHVPRAGYVTIYDRSWYGRVLVERVEKFAREDEWKRAYHEINDFEEQLSEHGIIIAKFWIHLSADEQLRRFKEREKIAWKKHKITEEDWRNREKWDAYETAVNDMVTRTSTEYAPWTLVPGNDKLIARVEIVKTFCKRLEEALE